MKWLLLWFTLSGAPVSTPERMFDTEAECVAFAKTRAGLVAWKAEERVRFECRALPYINPHSLI